MKESTKQTTLRLYEKGYTIDFLAEFFQIEKRKIRLWVFEKDEKKKYKKASDVPNSRDKENLVSIPVLKKEIIEELPSVIKGLTLVGYNLKEIAETIGVSEESLTELVGNVDEIREAREIAKRKINIKIVESLLASILPREIYERTYKMIPDSEGNVKRELVKEVIKDYAGNVEGMFKWLELNAPETWSPKAKSLKDMLEEAGVLVVSEDVEEAEWEESAVGQQDNLVDMMDHEKQRLESEYDES